MTIANDLRPKLFKDFLGQKGSINYLTSAIKHNVHSNGVLVTGNPGTGKCLGKDTPVIMYDGTIKLVQDVKINDLLMGDDSTPRKVLGITQGTDQLYKVVQKNGDDYVINSSHILSLKGCSLKKTSKYFYENKIDINLKDYFLQNNSFKKRMKGYKVKVDFNSSNSNLPIPPYLLGFWLGNGTSSKPQITFNAQHTEVINYIKKLINCLECVESQVKLKGLALSVYYKSSINKGSNLFLEGLQSLNVLNNKHIPHCYLTSSRKNRLELLSGLLDSDGYKNNTSYEIAQKNNNLSNDIIFLCRSLGFKTSVNKTFKKCQNFEGSFYNRIFISSDDYSELRLKNNYKKLGKVKRQRRYDTTEIKIEDCGIGSYFGFQLDGNKRFLLGDFTVTHNSSAAFLYAKATLCENRLEGAHEPCGKCDSCLTEVSNMNHPNITYYRITEASVFKEAVNDLITMSKAAPVLTHSNIREDNYRRFIIIDECQSASKQSISPFLDALEFAAEHVTVILISMDLDSMDKTVKDAIESRCIELSFNPISEESISLSLTNHYTDLNKEAADLIAYLCKGNVRQAWSLLEYFSTQFRIQDINSSIIAEHKLNSLTSNICTKLIQTIENGVWLETEKIIKRYLNDSISSVNYFLLRLLENDLNLKGIELVSVLSFWLQSNYKVPLISIFRPFQNHELLQPIVKKEVIENSKQQIQSIATKQISEQLQRILGKPIVVPVDVRVASKPEYLYFNSWKMFLNYYADN